MYVRNFQSPVVSPVRSTAGSTTLQNWQTNGSPLKRTALPSPQADSVLFGRIPFISKWWKTRQATQKREDEHREFWELLRWDKTPKTIQQYANAHEIGINDRFRGQEPFWMEALNLYGDSFDEPLMDFLVETMGADVNATRESGFTALMDACWNGGNMLPVDFKQDPAYLAFQWLLKQKADANAVDDHGDDALYNAVQAKNYRAYGPSLLAAGAVLTDKIKAEMLARQAELFTAIRATEAKLARLESVDVNTLEGPCSVQWHQQDVQRNKSYLAAQQAEYRALTEVTRAF